MHSVSRHGKSEMAVTLRCGRLQVRVERADLDLEELCGFAGRRSRKRGFVFVSKVLGKHYPVRPRLMADVHERLATKLNCIAPGPVLFIAMAETAIGLGQGVYECWLRPTGRADALFLHSTRYLLDRPVALRFDESHSHATAHLVYEPADAAHQWLFRNAETLVLIDDELSTGKTLVNLALEYRRLNPRLRAVHLVSLTDWLGSERRGEIAGQLGVSAGFHSLLEGRFHLDHDAAFDPGPIPDVTGRGDFKDALLTHNHGRLGISGPTQYDLEGLLMGLDVRPGQRVLVLGSGEFVHAPFLLSQRLEALGAEVYFQATTRSPLLVECDLTSVLEFTDNYHDAMPNYVYNVADRDYDKVLIGYETRPLPVEHTLPVTLGATPVYFDDPQSGFAATT